MSNEQVLCLLIDLVPMDEMSAQQQEETLLNELGQYRPDLLERPRIVVGTKADMASTEIVESFGDRLVISSITHSGVSELVGQMASVVHESRSVEPHHEGLS